MIGSRAKLGTPRGAIALRAAWGAALACVALWAANAHAYPMYDDGMGNGCVECHNGFKGGNGPLHFQHRTQFGVTTCNLCHPSGGGTVPVLTYSSGPGGGFGCAGCHGQDYGEVSPNSGQAKATAYGLRQFHVNYAMPAVPSCGTSGCHQPGALGHPDPFPPLFGENVAPPYYAPAFSNLTDPCSSVEEDISFDPDSVGLDNDGDGLVDYPADPDCPEPTTTTTSTTTSTTLVCGPEPAGGCIAPGKGVLLVNEKTAGKERLRVVLRNLQPTVAPSDFGNPVAGGTGYKVCIYDAANTLRGEYTVARAGDTCGTHPCWSTVSSKGYKYRDSGLTADGILTMTLLGGDPGKGKVVVVGKNNASTLPTGIAPLLQNESGATVQLVTSDAACFGVNLTQVKKADGAIFKALGP